MTNIIDLVTEDKAYKLWKVWEFSDLKKEKWKFLYKPDQNLTPDKQIVKNKHHSTTWQYIKNKPVKFWLKLWILAVTTGTDTNSTFMQEQMVVKPSVKMVLPIQLFWNWYIHYYSRDMIYTLTTSALVLCYILTCWKTTFTVAVLLPKTIKASHPISKVEKLGPEGKKEVIWGGPECHHT